MCQARFPRVFEGTHGCLEPWRRSECTHRDGREIAGRPPRSKRPDYADRRRRIAVTKRGTDAAAPRPARASGAGDTIPRMSTKRDRDLGMHRAITRRDFIGGVAVGLGGASLAGRLCARRGAACRPIPGSSASPATTRRR